MTGVSPARSEAAFESPCAIFRPAVERAEGLFCARRVSLLGDHRLRDQA